MKKSRVLIGALLIVMISVPVMIFYDPLIRNLTGNLDDSQEKSNSELFLLPPEFSLTNDYQLTWESNQIRGSTHSIALTDDKALMAAGGGYLSDNTLHIYRWDNTTKNYNHVWDSGDRIIANDILSVEFADTDNNGLLEVIAGCADGRVYMFEQQGYEGSATADYFDHVWDSGSTLTKQVWAIATDDLDSDGLKEVIAGCWDNKVHVFEYEWHSGWPHCEEHLIDMTKVWDTGDDIDTRVLSVATGDTDNDGLKELIVGSYDGKLHIFEFLPCGVHRYEKVWDSGDLMFNPIVSITLSNDLDEDPYGEIAVSSYGQGVFTIQYDSASESYESMELMQPIATWEQGLLPTTGVYSGYELDPYADKKIYGWEEQGVFELEDPIPYPWNIPEIGGNSSLPGPRDSNYTTFQPRDVYSYMGRIGVGGEAPGEVAYPTSIAFDASGNMYIVDKGNHRIQKFSNDGEYITHWGGFGTGDGYFADPHGITIGSDNHVYVTDSANHRVQKFTITGAHNASWGSYGSNDDEFIYPEGIAIDDYGFLYVSDTGNNRVKKMNSTTGEVIDIWTGFDTPRGIAVNFNDFIFIVDSHHHQVQIYNYTGEYLGAWGSFGADADTFVDPRGIAIDSEGHVFITDYSLDQIKKFTWWGTFIGYWGSTGIDPGEFYHPEGVAIGPQKYVYIADSGVNRTQLFALETYQLLNNWEHEDLEITMGSACDSSDNLYVTDYYNGTIKKFSPSGLLIAILSVNGSEPGELFQPWGIAVDSNDDLYVSEIGNHRISKFTSEGTFILTWGTLGSSSSEFNNPVGVALDSANNVYIADMYNNRIQKFNSQGDFIMEWGSTGSGDGEFSAPAGIDIDSNDVVYVVDYLNHRIQFFSNTGTFSDSFSVTGPVDIAIDESCHIYTNTPPYTSIMKYTKDGVLITELEGRIAGYNITTDLHKASTIALDNHGTLYASGEHQVMKIQPGVVHTNVAEVILDFGKYEEISGMGNSNNDLDITMPYTVPFPNFMNMEFAISQDGETFVTLPTSLSTFAMKPPRLHLGFDVDPILQANKWKSFRYLKIGVKHGVSYRIDAVWGVLARPIPTALSLTIGQVRSSGTLPTDR
ncbi:MAG: 6-bladed beta-propeller, partial [Candidatus Thorarchaeota archaeon]